MIERRAVARTRVRRCFSWITMLLVAVAGITFLGGLPKTAQAEEPPAAAEILKRMDATIGGWADQIMDIEMTVIDVNGAKKSYTYTVHQLGGQKRLIRFTSGEITGMAVLSLDRNRVFVYLPGFKKVRRVAAHNLNQPFAGSDFSQEDMAVSQWSDTYDATLLREDDTTYYLRCMPKPGEKTPHAYVEIQVEKQGFYQRRVDYIETDGKPSKFMTNENIIEYAGGVKRHSRITMTDAKTGHRTELQVKDFRVNVGLKEDQFTQRQLQWGR